MRGGQQGAALSCTWLLKVHETYGSPTDLSTEIEITHAQDQKLRPGQPPAREVRRPFGAMLGR